MNRCVLPSTTGLRLASWRVPVRALSTAAQPSGCAEPRGWSLVDPYGQLPMDADRKELINMLARYNGCNNASKRGHLLCAVAPVCHRPAEMAQDLLNSSSMGHLANHSILLLLRIHGGLGIEMARGRDVPPLLRPAFGNESSHILAFAGASGHFKAGRFSAGLRRAAELVMTIRANQIGLTHRANDDQDAADAHRFIAALHPKSFVNHKTASQKEA